MLAAEREGAGGKITVVLRKAILDGAAEDGHVARGGDLLVVGQAGGVAIDRVRHAERARLGRHQLGELLLAAAERLGDDHRDVIGRLGDDGADRGLDRDGLAGLEAELGGRLRPRHAARRVISVLSLILPASSRSNSR